MKKRKLNKENIEMLIELIIALNVLNYFVYMSIKGILMSKVCQIGFIGWIIIGISLFISTTIIFDFKDQLKKVSILLIFFLKKNIVK